MKYLDTILSEQKLGDEMINSIKKYDAVVDKKLKQSGIEFTDEDSEMVFCNHIVALIKRCVTNDFVAEIDESLMDEISKEAYDIASFLVSDLFEENGCEKNKSEIFLVSTHIQMYLDSKKQSI